MYLKVFLLRFDKAHKKVLLALFTLFLCTVTYFLLPDAYFSSLGRKVTTIFIFAVIFWAFEILPLFITALIIVLALSVWLLNEPIFQSLNTKSYELFFSDFASPVIILFFGGFVFAAAIHKHNVDSFLISHLMQRVGKSVVSLFLFFLFISAFISMWISNTAAATIMLSLAQPIFSALEKEKSLKKLLLLAIAFGCNAGGMGTPIGTPPNAIVMGILREYGIQVSFLGWMLMALPLVILLLVLVGVILLLFYRPKAKTLHKVQIEKQSLSKQGKVTLGIALITIILWLTGPIHHVSEALVALFAVILLSICRLIAMEDLKSIEWGVLILMWGGLALGSAVEITNIPKHLSSVSLITGHSLLIIAFFCIVALTLSTLISNTATASLVLPIAVGVAMVDKSLISITVALSCSLAMILPVSTPPNAIVYSTGFLETKDMVQPGLCIAITGLTLILLGFEIMIPRLLI